MTHPLRHTLYRAYLKNLQHIPDPHVWRTHQPYLRSLLDRPRGFVVEQEEPSSAEGPLISSQLRESARETRRIRGLVRAKEELKKLRAATACHPHALRRLLAEAYGQRGRVRWELIDNIITSDPSKPTNTDTVDPHPPLPSPLLPLIPHRKPAPENTNRLRPVPEVAVRKAAHRVWERHRREVAVPLILPPNPEGWNTGWEEKDIIQSLRLLSGLEALPPRSKSLSPGHSGLKSAGQPRPHHPHQIPTPLARDLPSYPHLPSHIRVLIPNRQPPAPSRAEDVTYSRPRPGETRQNPRTWGPPRLLRARLVRRMYQRLWASLRWVRCKEDGTWVEGKYEDVFRQGGEGASVVAVGDLEKRTKPRG